MKVNDTIHTIITRHPHIASLDVTAGDFHVEITPKLSSETDGARFEFFHHHEKLDAGSVESTAEFLGVSGSLMHGGLCKGYAGYYFVRAINEFGKGLMHCVSVGASSASDATIKSHEEAKLIMDAKKVEIRANASPLVGGILGETSAFLSAYERPAIVIIDRAGDIESTMEFATAADYKAWKGLQ